MMILRWISKDHYYFNQKTQTNYSIILSSHLSETNIWKKVKSGNLDALSALYNLYVDDLYRYGLRYTYDKEAIMDNIHDLFLDIYKYRKNISKEVNVRSYLFKSFKRKLNRKHKSKVYVFPEREYQDSNVERDFAPSVERLIIEQETEAQMASNLSAALNGLTKTQIQCISLRFRKNKSYEDIAEIMDITIGTARTLIYRSIKKLRKELAYL
ncbi:sigma-70 family RNA polymerase sigma factor [Seonamhaeicola sp.]|uniref:RNA polymerase sigma factor n=1 Tax=Seonamhaeicola sp. TaxID=1912245 RepID=UPI00261430FB|nr:sigma-70 family RNA polymerase sigma factor [Seonamhaeicola sp.]